MLGWVRPRPHCCVVPAGNARVRTRMLCDICNFDKRIITFLRYRPPSPLLTLAFRTISNRTISAHCLNIEQKLENDDTLPVSIQVYNRRQ